MIASTLIALLAVNPLWTLPTATWQPTRPSRGEVFNLPAVVAKKKAILLVPGLKLHPIHPALSTEPEVHNWQKPDSALVQELKSDFDVYAIGYAQTLPLDAVSLAPGLHAKVAELRGAGYREIVLVGHSAGGVISKQFVEQFPKAGVTKVIQIAAPNSGSSLANIGIGLPKPQIPFIKSMTPETRSRVLARSKPLPEGLQFASVVAKAGRLQGDTVVSFTSQWPDELQQQGVPAVLVLANHYTVMNDPDSVKLIGELARERIVRWTDAEVKQGRKILFDTQFGKGLGLGIIRR